MTKTKTIKATKRASKLLEELSGPMSESEFNSMSKKEQRDAIIALFFPNKCEVNLAKYVLKEREEKCGMIGGARRRRGATRRGRSTSTSRSNASSTTSSSTNTPTQQTAEQVAQAAAATGQQPPSEAAVQEASSGDIYDLLSIIIVGGGTFAAGSLAIASGLDEGLDALIVANGGTSLSHCTTSSSVTSQLMGSFWGWQQPDMCTRAMDQMDALIVAVPVAITALCRWFGVRNPVTIMAEAARDSQRAIAERLRGCFTRPPRDPPSPALIHAAALAIDAQRARQTQGNQAAASIIQGAHSPSSQQSTSPQQSTAQAVQGLRNIAQQARTRGRSRTSRTSTASNSQAPPQSVAQAMRSQMPHRTGVSPSVSPVAEMQTAIPPITGFQPSPVPAVTSPTSRQDSISSLSSNNSATSSSSSDSSGSEESSSDNSNSPTPKSPEYSATTPPSPLVQPKTVDTSSTRGTRRSARLRSKTPEAKTQGGRKKTRKHKGKKKGKKKGRHAKHRRTHKHKNRKHKRKGRKTKKH